MRSSATSGKMTTAPQALTERTMTDFMKDEPSAPAVVDRGTFQAELDALRVREKAHTREGDAIAAARRRLPMVEVDGATPLIGERGAVTLLDVFEGRRMLIAYYFMWHTGHPAAEQCEGCTFFTSQVRELSYIHARDVTYATFCQGPYEESARYRDFMGWEMPWYSAAGRSASWSWPGGHDALYVLLPAPKKIQCLPRRTGRGCAAFSYRGRMRRTTTGSKLATNESLSTVRQETAGRTRPSAGHNGGKASSVCDYPGGSPKPRSGLA